MFNHWIKMTLFSEKQPDYSWQDKAIQKWLKAGKQGMIEAVTGSGKSHVGIEALAKLYSEDKTLSALIIVPTIPLLEQWYEKLQERFPNKNIYHFISDLEWPKDIGNVKYSGPDILVKKEIFKRIEGYNEKLIAGEDPLFSLDIVKAGYNIIRLNRVACYHDMNMNSSKQYFKRCYRSGYGYAAAGLIMYRKGDADWIKKAAGTGVRRGLGKLCKYSAGRRTPRRCRAITANGEDVLIVHPGHLSTSQT